MSCIDDVGKPWSLRVITMSEDKLEALVRLYARTVIGLQTLEKWSNSLHLVMLVDWSCCCNIAHDYDPVNWIEYSVFYYPGQAMTSCRLQSNYSSTATLHGGPVVLLLLMMMMTMISRFVQCVMNGTQTRCRSAEQVGLQMSSERQWTELRFAGRLVNCSRWMDLRPRKSSFPAWSLFLVRPVKAIPCYYEFVHAEQELGKCWGSRPWRR